MTLTIACVRTGTKYGSYYVYRLKKAVEHHLRRPHRFVCLTDSPKDIRDLETVEIHELSGWWGKMRLFDPSWRAGQRAVYFDLDTVICGDLAPIADLDVPFGICESFTRLAGNANWPCHFGSCVMTFASDFGYEIFEAFYGRRRELMRNPSGDQKVIEDICDEFGYQPTLLQRVLPPGFFLGYRDLPKHKTPPKGCSVVVFAGSQKPHNTDCAWARDAWAA